MRLEAAVGKGASSAFSHQRKWSGAASIKYSTGNRKLGRASCAGSPPPPLPLRRSFLPATARSDIPGAFILEDMHLGTMVIPAGAKLIRVGDTAVGDMSFDEAKNLALSATVRSEFVFE